METLKSKVALVMGGGSGIGLGIARALLAEGCVVELADNREKALDEAAASIKGALSGSLCDVTDRRSVDTVVAGLLEREGRIDILVNSAGINVRERDFLSVDLNDFEKILRVNTMGTFNTMQAVLPHMKERKEGLIVNISSIAAKQFYAGTGVGYSVSKRAVEVLGAFGHEEGREHGIRVTTLYPGEVNTPFLDSRPEPVTAERRSTMLQPEDIADSVVFVAKLPSRAVIPELLIAPTRTRFGKLP